MAKIPIHFFSEEIVFNIKSKTVLRNWINQTVEEEKYHLQELNFIFCTDDYLLKINKEYLSHDTYTDIITFDHSESEENIAGDIFVSINRVKENAKTFDVDFYDELHRVMIHGTLHLLGYLDKSKKDKALMTQKEDFYLSKRDF
ncbi:MAG: rRNA maturation RNase YbeY [Pelobium sp.]